MPETPDHHAVDIGTIRVMGQAIRVCGRCLQAVDQHPTRAADTRDDAQKEDTPDGAVP